MVVLTKRYCLCIQLHRQSKFTSTRHIIFSRFIRFQHYWSKLEVQCIIYHHWIHSRDNIPWSKQIPLPHILSTKTRLVLEQVPQFVSVCSITLLGQWVLSYWSLNNIPNFILVAPVLLWNCYSVRTMWKVLPQYRKLLPLVVLNALIIIGGVFFWNVQILNRITSFSPLIYWTLALNYNKPWFKYILGYMLTWNLMQTALFAAFLPPA